MAATPVDSGDNAPQVLENNIEATPIEGLQGSAPLTTADNAAIAEMSLPTNDSAQGVLGNGFALSDGGRGLLTNNATDGAIQPLSSEDPPPTYEAKPPKLDEEELPDTSGDTTIQTLSSQEPPPSYEAKPPELEVPEEGQTGTNNGNTTVQAVSYEPPPTYEQQPPEV